MPDLVILDIRVEHPEPGWAALDLARLDAATTRMPVIIGSADAQQMRAQAARLAQMRCVTLEKPFDIDHVLGEMAVDVAAQPADDA